MDFTNYATNINVTCCAKIWRIFVADRASIPVTMRSTLLPFPPATSLLATPLLPLLPNKEESDTWTASQQNQQRIIEFSLFNSIGVLCMSRFHYSKRKGTHFQPQGLQRFQRPESTIADHRSSSSFLKLNKSQILTSTTAILSIKLLFIFGVFT